MKELTIQQKAKAYDKAFRIAQELYNDPNSSKVGKSYVRTVFPELKEREGERIRKDVLAFIRHEGQHIDKYKWHKWIAWLEKQGEKDILENTILDSNEDGLVAETIKYKAEQKPDDKVKPKFHEGEWITNGDYTWKIVEVKPLDYILQSQDGNIVDDSISHVDEQFHSFTIEDAKDGDVLYDGNNACLFRKKMEDDDAVWVDAYCGINSNNTFNINDEDECWCLACDCTPTTKEQRDLLFQKMKEAGYEWDAEKKKKLKKISQRMVSADAKEALYDKPIWSEKDEKILGILIDGFEDYSEPDAEWWKGLKVKECTKWLKSLKCRVQPKQEWSEE